jgi:hypothetical protein
MLSSGTIHRAENMLSRKQKITYNTGKLEYFGGQNSMKGHCNKHNRVGVPFINLPCNCWINHSKPSECNRSTSKCTLASNRTASMKPPEMNSILLNTRVIWTDIFLYQMQCASAQNPYKGDRSTYHVEPTKPARSELTPSSTKCKAPPPVKYASPARTFLRICQSAR